MGYFFRNSYSYISVNKHTTSPPCDTRMILYILCAKNCEVTPPRTLLAHSITPKEKNENDSRTRPTQKTDTNDDDDTEHEKC